MQLFSHEKTVLKLPNAEVIYIPNIYNEAQSNQYFNSLKNTISWQHDEITVFGKTYDQPRLTALYGEYDKPYTYSNITMNPKSFTPELLEIKTKIEGISEHKFTSVLLNLYRYGNDSNGWHADNEKQLGQNPVIASISFGEARWFHFKHRQLKTEKHKILLEHGSLLIMKGEMQHYWLHQIPKTKKQIGARINLTFRKLAIH